MNSKHILISEKFKELAKQKWKEGSEKYGEDAWRALTEEELRNEIQSELVDVYNYCEMIMIKHGINMTATQHMAVAMYDSLESVTNE